MSRHRASRITEIYSDAHWRRVPSGQFLDVPTAEALRRDGVTMVRLAPRSLWRRIAGRSEVGRDVSVARYLSRADAPQGRAGSSGRR